MAECIANAGGSRPLNTLNMIETEESENKTIATPKKVYLSSAFKGLLLAFLSGVSYAFCSVIVKSMTNIYPGQLGLYRFLAIISFSLPQAVKTQENLLGPRGLRVLLILRGIFGATDIFLHFLAFRYLPLGEASVIIFSVPVFVTIAARIFLKESCGIVQSISVAITFVGIIVIVTVPNLLSDNSVKYTREYIIGLVASFSSLIVCTCRIIVLRKMQDVHHSIIMFNAGWVGILETAILTVLTGHFSLHRCGLEQGLLILIGILSYVGSTLLTIALQLEQAGPVSIMRIASDIILAFLFQAFIFHNTPDVFSITGGVLVGFSVLLVILGKWVSSLPSESSLFKSLKFLTM